MTSRLGSHVFLATLALGFTNLEVRAASPRPGPEVAERRFDARDVLVVIPDFDSTHPDAEPEPAASARRRLSDNLLDLIRASIGVDASHATIDADGTLRLTASPEAAEQVEHLLQKLRKRYADHITLKTRMLTLDRDAVRSLPQELKKTLLLSWYCQSAASQVTLSQAQVDELLKTVEHGASAHLTNAPSLTLFNGQRAYLLVETQKAFVRGYEHAGGQWEPQVGVASYGILLDARTCLSDDGTHVGIDLICRSSELLGMRTAPFAVAPAGLNLTVDVPDVQVNQVQTIVSLLDKTTMLLALPRQPAESKAGPGARGGDAAISPDRMVFALITPEVRH